MGHKDPGGENLLKSSLYFCMEGPQTDSYQFKVWSLCEFRTIYKPLGTCERGLLYPKTLVSFLGTEGTSTGEPVCLSSVCLTK